MPQAFPWRPSIDPRMDQRFGKGLGPPPATPKAPNIGDDRCSAKLGWAARAMSPVGALRALAGGWSRRLGKAKRTPASRHRNPRRFSVRRSGYEFYAVGVAAAPNHLAWLALRMSRHQRQSEPVADVKRNICHDLRAARRDVQNDAFALRHFVLDRDPGRLLLNLPSRFTLHLRPWLIDSHDDHSVVGPNHGSARRSSKNRPPD